MGKQRKDSRTGSRHKSSRSQIGFPADLYAAIVELAERNDRTINREAAIAIREKLEREGLWPPKK